MRDNVRDHIARLVREEMDRQGKRHRELAAVLGVDQSSTTLRINGRRSFRAEELVKVAAWLQVPVDRLLPSPTVSERAA